MANIPDIWRDMDRNFMPLGSWRPLLRQFDDFMNDMAGGRMGEEMRMLTPAVDIEETEDAYLINIDVPGLEKDDIDIEINANRLKLSGERKFEREGGDLRSRVGERLMERRFGRFERVLTLPEDVNVEQVEADYRNGVLMIAIPKAPEGRRQRIKVGEGKGLLKGLLAGKIVKNRVESNAEKGSERSEKH